MGTKSTLGFQVLDNFDTRARREDLGDWNQLLGISNHLRLASHSIDTIVVDIGTILTSKAPIVVSYAGTYMYCMCCTLDETVG